MSVMKWLAGGALGDAAATARLDAGLMELYHAVAPQVQAGAARSLAVTSSEAREGRTRVALYLGESLADNLAGRFLLADAGGARAALHGIYGLDHEVGLIQVLRGEATLAEAVRPTTRENLDVLPQGPGELVVGETAAEPAIARMLAEVRSDYQAVVFDTGPLLEAQEALVFAHSVQALLLVVLAGSTQGEVLARAYRLLQRTRAQVLGVVINDPRGEFVRDER